MSKMDDLRAMREARYAKASAPSKPASRPRKPPPARPAEVEAPVSDTEERLCGHRAISGRTCTREHGHTAKSHRYS